MQGFLVTAWWGLKPWLPALPFLTVFLLEGGVRAPYYCLEEVDVLAPHWAFGEVVMGGAVVFSVMSGWSRVVTL